MTILLAYATKHGSTREVADAIADTLRRSGNECDVRPAATVTDLTGYDAVVLGGSLYMTRWHPDALRFLDGNRDALAVLPFAVYALGPLTLSDKDVAGSQAQLDKALAKFTDLSPAATAVFGGVVDPKKLRFPFSRMPATDARDWDAITVWAESLAATFARPRELSHA